MYYQWWKSHLECWHQCFDVFSCEVCLKLLYPRVEVVGDDDEQGHPSLGERELQGPGLQLLRVASLEEELSRHHGHLQPDMSWCNCCQGEWRVGFPRVSVLSVHNGCHLYCGPLIHSACHPSHTIINISRDPDPGFDASGSSHWSQRRCFIWVLLHIFVCLGSPVHSLTPT